MKTEWLNDLKIAYDSEEKLFQSISRVLNLFLAATDLPQDEIRQLRMTLNRLTQETIRHEHELKELIIEAESNDN
jgi:hypothetical protein